MSEKELTGDTFSPGMPSAVVGLDRFREMVSEEMDLLPQIFFKELSGGVIVEEYAKPHPMRKADDLYIMGEYRRSYSMGKGIVLYYGSFARNYGNYDEELMRTKIREVLRHEFRHHLEGMAGSRDLEIEDEVFLRKYLESHGVK